MQNIHDDDRYQYGPVHYPWFFTDCPQYISGMENGANALERLPTEVFDLVLGLLYPREWRTVRLVSRQWNDLCQRLIWKKVTVAPMGQHVGADPPGLFNFDEFYSHDLGGVWFDSPVTVTYQRIRQLARNQHFQAALKNTTELYIYYDHGGEMTQKRCARTFDTMAELFKLVSKVGVRYYPDTSDYKFERFQRMLDVWKPSVDFCLELVAFHPIGDEAYIDTDGMNIREVFISRYFDGMEGMPLLPLSRTKDKIPVRLSNLKVVSPDLIALEVETNYNVFGWKWVPDTIKYLHLSNQLGSYTSDTKLKIPRGVEHLHIEDNFELDGSPSDAMASILVCIDLEDITQLKTLSYDGEDVSNELTPAILQVKSTLERLTLRCTEVTSESSFNFRDLVHAGLGLKQLQISVGAIGHELSDFQYFMGGFPELELLQLALDNGPVRPNLIEEVLNEFLRGCPKLTRIQLIAVGPLECSKSLITPSHDDESGLHFVDVSIIAR
ncbi:hypothetical protein TRVA0_013S02344 [Trichomonascus vanleenenianus]|uniref:F-box protein n=1 Tax=Trichomonascus vanleenenianus TaxID=2268995 RepID=UPI003ECACBAD